MDHVPSERTPNSDVLPLTLLQHKRVYIRGSDLLGVQGNASEGPFQQSPCYTVYPLPGRWVRRYIYTVCYYPAISFTIEHRSCQAFCKPLLAPFGFTVSLPQHGWVHSICAPLCITCTHQNHPCLI